MYGCPRSSRHWIITTSIFPYHFSDAEFQLAYGDNTVKNEVTQDFLPRLIPKTKKPIFDMARETFDSLLILSSENQKLIDLAKNEIIDRKVWKGGEAGKLPPFVSVHFRKYVDFFSSNVLLRSSTEALIPSGEIVIRSLQNMLSITFQYLTI